MRQAIGTRSRIGKELTNTRGTGNGRKDTSVSQYAWTPATGWRGRHERDLRRPGFADGGLPVRCRGALERREHQERRRRALSTRPASSIDGSQIALQFDATPPLPPGEGQGQGTLGSAATTMTAGPTFRIVTCGVRRWTSCCPTNNCPLSLRERARVRAPGTICLCPAHSCSR